MRPGGRRSGETQPLGTPNDAGALQQVGLEILDHVEDIAVDTAAVRQTGCDGADHVAMAVREEVVTEEALWALLHLGQ